VNIGAGIGLPRVLVELGDDHDGNGNQAEIDAGERPGQPAQATAQRPDRQRRAFGAEAAKSRPAGSVGLARRGRFWPREFVTAARPFLAGDR
jgi:hypothetical protein